MTIEDLHKLFISLGGMALPLSPFHKDHWTESLWFDWSRRFTEQDLRIVMRYKKEMVKTRNWNQATLSFRNTIADSSKFGEFLVEARAHYRCKPVVSDKISVLRSTGREMPQTKPRKISEIDWTKGISDCYKAIDSSIL